VPQTFAANVCRLVGGLLAHFCHGARISFDQILLLPGDLANFLSGREATGIRLAPAPRTWDPSVE
jgi:hypothetical protein